MSGKGSRYRRTNAQKYNDNYERIFCKKGDIPQHLITEKATMDILDYEHNGAWRPANGGRETPFYWADKEYLYMYNHETGEHAYYNATDDRFEQNVEMN